MIECPPNYWIFQANPDRYNIVTSLEKENAEYWNLRQHWKDVRKGDNVFIWLSGGEAGIYARGTVLTETELRSDSTQGQHYWSKPEEGRKPRSRVLVRYDEKYLDRPLLRRFLVHDPELEGLSILTQPRGTNFRVTAYEWRQLESWLCESD